MEEALPGLTIQMYVLYLYFVIKPSDVLNYHKLEYFLSPPRLNRFLLASGNSKSKAKKLYRINLRVCQNFYPLLNLFETFLRNAIDHQLAIHFDNPNWIIAEKNGFMSDSSLASSRFFLKNAVTKAERIIRNSGKPVHASNVIAEQSFGFWTALYDNHHYRLLRGSIIHCFAHKPTSINRSTISQKLNRIRKFRNRIYHNEPICFENQMISFQEAEKIRKEIFDMALWIDPQLSSYLQYFDATAVKMKQIAYI